MSRQAGSVWLVILLTMLAHMVLAQSVLGQVSVQIVDQNGHPIPAVRVGAYGLAELLEVTSTSTKGRATLRTNRWGEVRRLSLSHLGFQTLIVQAGDLPMTGIIALVPQPIELDGFRVEARGEVCPIEDNAAARALWAEVAALYSPDTGTRGLSGTFFYGVGQVQETDLYHVDRSRLSPKRDEGTGVVWRPVNRTVGPIEQFVTTDGYAWTPARVRWSFQGPPRDLNRVYPAFDVWHAYHFATPVFGELHHFAVLQERDDVTTLAFCPNGRGKGTSIMGVIELTPVTGFLTAEWRFQTDDPDEGAGGEVTFVSHREGEIRMPHLLAARGIFFRHNGKKSPYPNLPRSYYREVRTDIQWQVFPPSRGR